MRLIFTMTFLIAFFSYGKCQKQITGTITSTEDNEPIIGASVFEEGTENGTITDIDGKYQITVAENVNIVISFLGYTTEIISVEGKTIVDISLTEDSYQLKDVIVTAFGIEKEKKSDRVCLLCD